MSSHNLNKGAVDKENQHSLHNCSVFREDKELYLNGNKWIFCMNCQHLNLKNFEHPYPQAISGDNSRDKETLQHIPVSLQSVHHMQVQSSSSKMHIRSTLLKFLGGSVIDS